MTHISRYQDDLRTNELTCLQELISSGHNGYANYSWGS